MPLVIPDLQNITNGTNGYDFQAISDATDDAAWQAALDQSAFVISGMTVSPSSGLTVAVAAGWYAINGQAISYAGGTVTATSASASDRRDIVTINSGGTLTVTAGTPCGTAGWTRAASTSSLGPVKPSIPSGGCLLGELGILSTTTTVASINIVDKTMLSLPNYLAHVQYTKAANYTTTSATVAAVDSTNVTMSFVAPPSGNVILTATFLCQSTTTTSFATFNWLNHGLSTILSGSKSMTIKQDLAANETPQTFTQLVTGLTAGSTYSVDLGWAVTSGDTLTMYPNVAATTAVGTAAAGVILLTAEPA